MKWIVILILGGCLAESTLGWTYHYSKNTMNWTEARRWCQAHFTDMVVIQNQRENDYVVSMLPNRTRSPHYWIGITKNHKNETWTWIGNNSTWISEHSWAKNEPNNDHSTEFCVEIYLKKGSDRGKWNDEKCANKKFAVCYQAQCNETTCDGGTCQETIENTTCVFEPGFEGDSGQKGEEIIYPAVGCPALSKPDNGYSSCSEGSQIFNTTCQFSCDPGFLITGSSTVTCGINEGWNAPKPACASYKQALLAVLGCGAASSLCCISLCWMKHRKRKKIAHEAT